MADLEDWAPAPVRPEVRHRDGAGERKHEATAATAAQAPTSRQPPAKDKQFDAAFRAFTAWLRIKGYQTTSTDKHPHERHKAVLNKYLSAIPTPSGRAEKVREMLRRLASGGASRTTQSKLREVPVKHTRKVFLFSNFAWSIAAIGAVFLVTALCFFMFLNGLPPFSWA